MSPRSVLPTLEKGGSTPSKNALALRAAACEACSMPREPRPDVNDQRRVAAQQNKNKGTRKPHLGGGLGRGEHVIIAPDVEKVGGGSALGGGLAELVGAHSGACAQRGHSSGGRGEGSRRGDYR